ncbi:MAG: RNA methyltransferase [Actinobacteria bacterium]|nr:RNA methyltransferase [Actinomycetota bacterium]MBW3641372.1 RNA methyltransferase [Actinomycetota bacterium]
MARRGPLGARHQKVQRLRRLVARRSAREAEAAFVLEGDTLLGEALDAGVVLEAVFIAPLEGPISAAVRRAEAAGVRVYELAPGVLERVAGTVTPQPVLAIAQRSDVTLEEVADATLVVVCVDVRDPGNAGSVLRSAEAAGAGAVFFCRGSVDVFNPKTVRSSAGSLFHVPVVSGGDPVEVLQRLGDREFRRVATVARGGVPYDEVDLAGRVAVVMGNEANGLPPILDPHIDVRSTIPMAGRAESLNVGVAAALMCFEALRQRRRVGA